MEFKFGLTIAVLLAVVTKGHSQLQCYVCENCAKIDKNTPLQTCNGDPVVTTTMIIPSEISTTSDMSTSEGTSSTGEPTTRTSGLPTPATIGPIPSTTGIPTPPSIPTVVPMNINAMEMAINPTSSVNSTLNLTLTTQPTLFVTPTFVVSEEPTTILPSLNVTFNTTEPSTLLVRQRRNIPENGMTYHCYKVQKKYDNVYGVQRGCMGVLTQQSVCAELKAANGNQTNKCQPCSTNKCNGSSTIGVSIATLLVALVALIYRV